jgi:serine/threonine protein phosphatase PrpC
MSIHHVSFARSVEAQVAIGRKDSLLQDDQRGLFAVSSGPPAPGGGDFASKIFLASLSEHGAILSQNVASLSSPTGSWRRVKAVFDGIFQVASQTIRATYGSHSSPDTSATVLVIRDGMGVMAHVGTTRGYIIRGGRVVRVTHDHSGAAQRPVHNEGTMVALQPLRSTGQQGLGQQAPLAVDAISFKIQPVSRMVLCSAGVAGIVAGKDLLTASMGAPSLDAMAGAIIRHATQRQIVADASVVIVDIAG